MWSKYLSFLFAALFLLLPHPTYSETAQWGGGVSAGDAEFGVYSPILLDLSGKELAAGKQVYFGFRCKEKNGFVEAKLRVRVYGEIGLNAPGTLRRTFLFLGADADSDVPLSFVEAGSSHYELYDKMVLTSLLKTIAYSNESHMLLLARDRMLVLPPGNAALLGALNARKRLLACFEGPGNANSVNFQLEDGHVALADQARSILAGRAPEAKNCYAANVRLNECVNGIDMNAGGVQALVCGGHQPGTFGSPAARCSPRFGYWCDFDTGTMYESRAEGAEAICP